MTVVWLLLGCFPPNRRGASLSLFHFHPTINEFRVGRSLIKELSASGRCERLDERRRGGYKSRSNRNQLFATFLMEWEASMLQQAHIVYKVDFGYSTSRKLVVEDVVNSG